MAFRLLIIDTDGSAQRAPLHRSWIADLKMRSPSQLVRQVRARLIGTSDLGRTMIKAAVGSAGLRLVHAVLRFVIGMLMARLLAPAGYGVYSFAMALASVVAILPALGIPGLAVREIAVTNAQQDWGHMRGFIRWAHISTGVFSVVVLITGFGVLFALGHRIDPVRQDCIALALFLVPLMSLGALRSSMLRGLRKVVLSQLPERLVQPMVILAGLLILYFSAQRHVSPTGTIYLQLLAAGIAFCFGLFWFLRNRPSELSYAEPVARSNSWLKSTIPFALMAAMQTINGTTDILILGLLREDAEVGIYRVAVQLATAVTFGLQIVNLIQAPHIAHMHAIQDKARLQRMITKSSRGMLLITFPVVIILILFGEVIIRVAFGTAYQEAYLPLAILCLGQLFNASIGSVRSVLNMTGNEHETTKGLFVGMITNVVLNFALIPVWGMVGAAIATTCTLIVWNVMLWRATYAKTGIETSPLFRWRR